MGEVLTRNSSAGSLSLSKIMITTFTTSLQCAHKLRQLFAHSIALSFISLFLKCFLLDHPLTPKMGNLCGKESSDPFAQPGRTLSSAPAPSNNKTSSLPRKVGGSARTLGLDTSNTQSSSQQEGARRKAAEAAEARAKAASKPTGKLGSQLQEQRKQKRTDTLEATSRDERRMRDADSAAETRAYN